MATVHPYLNFNGNTEDAFNFYKSVFGVEFLGFQRYRDIPDNDSIPEHLLDKIMHVVLPIGEGTNLMGTDALEELGQKLTFGNNHYISLNTESKEEAEHLYFGLSQGGIVEMELSDTFWGAYFGMFEDKFGIHWMVNYDYPNPK
jgi:PhnB protein